MAEILKHAYDTLYCIRHTLRELPSQKRHSNEDIDFFTSWQMPDCR